MISFWLWTTLVIRQLRLWLLQNFGNTVILSSPLCLVSACLCSSSFCPPCSCSCTVLRLPHGTCCRCGGRLAWTVLQNNMLILRFTEDIVQNDCKKVVATSGCDEPVWLFRFWKMQLTYKGVLAYLHYSDDCLLYWAYPRMTWHSACSPMMPKSVRR